jgi:Carboxypeptidase regulatory-like domain
MRFSGIRLPLLAAVACASVGLSLSATDRSYGQAIYVYPTSTTVSLSTPYLLPRSYVVPSSSAFPSYIESAYTVEPAVSLLPTGYIATTYRRGLFGRRWIVERPVVAAYATSYLPTAYVPTTYVSGYVPTTYVSPTYYSTSYRVRRYRPTTYTYYPSTYYPTVYETAYSSAGDICCDEIVADAPARSVQQGNAASSAPRGGSKEVESRSGEDPSFDARVDLPLPNEADRLRSTLQDDTRTKAQTKANVGGAATPPNPQAADADDEAVSRAATKGAAGGAGVQKNAPAQKSGGSATPKTKAATPTAPDDESNPIELESAPVRRDSMKALYPRLRTADRRNILFGSVETDDGRPRGEVPVIVVNRNNSAVRHNGVSDAFGGFAIQVPDGQWRVRVTMPSGNTQAVRDITVTNGRVMDNYEAREVQNLIISY